MTGYGFTSAMLCALSLAIASPAARAQMSDALESMVLVQRVGSSEKPRTGIVVSEAGHVVFVRNSGDDPYTAAFVVRRAALALPSNFDWSALPRAEIVSISDHPDLILVRVPGLGAKAFPVAAADVEPDAPLYSSRIEGAAQAPFLVFYQHWMGDRTRGTDPISLAPRRHAVISSNIAIPAMGSPVFDRCGGLAAMTTQGYAINLVDRGARANFYAVTGADIVRFVVRHQVVASLAAICPAPKR